jgi:hypothetical protein
MLRITMGFKNSIQDAKTNSYSKILSTLQARNIYTDNILLFVKIENLDELRKNA